MKFTPGIHTPVRKSPKGVPFILCVFLCVSTSCKNMQYKKILLCTCSKLCSYLMIVFLVVNLWHKVCLTMNSTHLQRENVCLRQRPQPDTKQSILSPWELCGVGAKLSFTSPPTNTTQSLPRGAAGAIQKGDKLWLCLRRSERVLLG